MVSQELDTVLAVTPALTEAPADRYINRELSWLAFNERVLEEARNTRHPLLERLRFLSISASNLDEFQMVRVAGLKAQVDAGVTTPGIDGLSPAHQLTAIKDRSKTLIDGQYVVWRTLRDCFHGREFRWSARASSTTTNALGSPVTSNAKSCPC